MAKRTHEAPNQTLSNIIPIAQTASLGSKRCRLQYPREEVQLATILLASTPTPKYTPPNAWAQCYTESLKCRGHEQIDARILWGAGRAGATNLHNFNMGACFSSLARPKRNPWRDADAHFDHTDIARVDG